MFKLAVVAALLSVTFAQYGHGYGAPASYGHNDLAQPIPYQYGFDIVGGDHHTGDFKQTRQEHGDGHGNVQGSYGYTDAHGIYRQVDYVADGHGFRANVKTNEPGTESQSPADVELHAQPVQGYASAPQGYASAPQGYASAPRPAYGRY